MKAVLKYIFLSIVLSAQMAGATKYYASQTGSGSLPGTSSVPVSFGTLNASTAPTAGDTIFLKKGDVFYGALTTRNGVVYTSYGTGANPVITGFQTLSSWTSEGGGIYSAAITATTVRSVLFNGYMKEMGRFPNTGFLPITSSSSATNFAVASLTGTWIGATAVVRSARYRYDVKQITAQIGTALTTQALSGKPPVGYGMYLENAMATLDQLGEWYFSGNKLYMFFGGASPSSYTIKASNVTNLVDLTSKSNVKIIGIDLQGANQYGVNAASATNCTISDCAINYSGVTAVRGTNSNGVRLVNVTALRSNSNGFDFSGSNNNAYISGCTLDSTGMYPGMGESNGSHLLGVYFNGSGNTVDKTLIRTCGGIGIQFKGSNFLCSRNLVLNALQRISDVGAIYSFNSDSTVKFSNRIISQNIVTLSASSPANAGTTDATANVDGIYLDDNTDHVNVGYNIVQGFDRYGLYVHNSNNLLITGNVLYNNLTQAMFKHRDPTCKSRIYNVTFTGNELLAKKSTQLVAEWWTYESDIASFGLFDYNYYGRPTAETNFIKVINSVVSNCSLVSSVSTNYTLSGWKALYGYDPHTTGTPAGASTVEADQAFDYNATDAAAAKTASWYFLDLPGTQYAPTYSLPAWGGVAGVKLIPQPSLADTDPPVPGSSGTITTSNIRTTSLTLSWTKATDNTTAQAALTYSPYKSTSNSLTDVTNTIDAGILVTSGTNFSSANVTGLTPATTYYFNIVVADAAGNLAVYTQKSATTAAASTTTTTTTTKKGKRR